MNKFTIGNAMRRVEWRQGGDARSWALACTCALGLSPALACQSAFAQAMYRIRPLGNLGGCTTSSPYGVALNEADEVAGYACNAHGDTHAFLWKNDGTPMVDLGPDEAGSQSYGYWLNASGLVAGDARDSTGHFGFVSPGNGAPMTRIYDGLGGSDINPTGLNELGYVTGFANTSGDTTEHAFLWKNDGSPMHDLGTLGGDYSDGFAINNVGQVAGDSAPAGNGPSHAVFWKNDGTPVTDLGNLGGGTCCLFLINASGQVAGSSQLPNPRPRHQRTKTHAFFWRNDGTPMQDLGTLGGTYSEPFALNDSGQLAGYSYTLGSNSNTQHAFVWMNDGKPMKDLGTFGGPASVAFGINASGQVTGLAEIAGGADRAFLWKNDGTKIQNLNKLIDPKDPLKPYVTLTIGDTINNLGDILAEGTDRRTGVSASYLLQGTVLTLAPRSLAFASQPIDTSSTVKSVTLTNTSTKIVDITNIALKGSNSGQFASINNCGSSLMGHAICTIKVTFKPTTTGAKSASLNVNGGGGGLRVVNLTGTGT